MNPVYSHNQSTWSQAKNFLLPSKEEVFLYLTIANVLLAAVNYRVFIELFTRGSGIESVDSSGLLSEDLTLVLYQAQVGLGTATVSGFWMIVGSIIYAIAWLARSLSLQAKEDAESIQDVAPEEFRKNYSHRIVSKYSALITSALGLVGYTYIMLTMLLPIFSKNAVLWATEGWSNNSILWLIGSIIGLTLAAYFLKLLLRTAKYMLSTISN